MHKPNLAAYQPTINGVQVNGPATPLLILWMDGCTIQKVYLLLGSVNGDSRRVSGLWIDEKSLNMDLMVMEKIICGDSVPLSLAIYI